MTIPFRELHDEWMKDPEYKREYDALEEEFARPKQKLIDLTNLVGMPNGLCYTLYPCDCGYCDMDRAIRELMEVHSRWSGRNSWCRGTIDMDFVRWPG